MIRFRCRDCGHDCQQSCAECAILHARWHHAQTGCTRIYTLTPTEAEPRYSDWNADSG